MAKEWYGPTIPQVAVGEWLHAFVLRVLLELYCNLYWGICFIQVLENDFFLVACRDEFIESARQLIFETFCRIHQCISIR